MSTGIGEVGVLTMMDFLLTEYANGIARQNGVTYDEAEAVLKRSAALMDFRKFAYGYLAANRPSVITNTEENYIVQLTNTKRFAIAPGVESSRGMMQPSTSVAVTGRETLAEIQAGTARGSTVSAAVPVGQQPQQNLKLGSPAFNFDQQGPYQRPQR